MGVMTLPTPEVMVLSSDRLAFTSGGFILEVLMSLKGIPLYTSTSSRITILRLKGCINLGGALHWCSYTGFPGPTTSFRACSGISVQYYTICRYTLVVLAICWQYRNWDSEILDSILGSGVECGLFGRDSSNCSPKFTS